MEGSSRISNFYKLGIEERLDRVKQVTGISEEEVVRLKSTGALSLDLADKMIENVIGTTELPVGVAVNFLIDGRDYLVPMAIEEPSVVAAASNGAKMAREAGGFFTSITEPVMIGQIQLMDIPDPNRARLDILRAKEDILTLANSKDPVLVKFGGGAKDLDVRVLNSPRGQMVVVHLLVDCRDAMGANAVNTMTETVSPLLVDITGGRAVLRIISNLADRRVARASATFLADVIGGEQVVDAILDAYNLAVVDPYRAATHNKGVMNGVSAVVLATANDTRAIESGAHAYAARNGSYLPLTCWEKNDDGNLVGTIELPVAVGLVGGATKTHPVAQVATKILGVKTAAELGRVIASVGLAQNFAALRALATEGIQKGHMKLHARNIAIAAGAAGKEADRIAEKMIVEGNIRMDRAIELLKEGSE